VSAGKTILLLESDEQIVKDVIASLRLIDVSVQLVRTASEVKPAAREKRPALILLRLRLQGDQKAVIELAAELAADEELREVPAAVLCTESEKRLLEGHLHLFDAAINLPVEFPEFTKQVQRVMEARRGGVTRESRPGPEAGEASQWPEAAQRNLGIACAIQHAVIEKLKREGRLFGAGAAAVAALVMEATAEICAHFDPRKPL